MGLEENRAIETAKTGWLPKRQKTLDDLAGGNVPYEIDWASFAGDVKGIQWCENNGPAMVEQAFRLVGKDDMGKKALREGVKKVVLRNVADAKAKKATFEKGTLELVFAFAQGTAGRVESNLIEKVLLKGL